MIVRGNGPARMAVRPHHAWAEGEKKTQPTSPVELRQASDNISSDAQDDQDRQAILREAAPWIVRLYKQVQKKSQSFLNNSLINREPVFVNALMRAQKNASVSWAGLIKAMLMCKTEAHAVRLASQSSQTHPL